MNFPASYKHPITYSALTYDAVESAAKGQDVYKYTETKTHYCLASEVLRYKTENANQKAAEEVRDSELIIESAQEEIDWVDDGLATKP